QTRVVHPESLQDAHSRVVEHDIGSPYQRVERLTRVRRCQIDGEVTLTSVVDESRLAEGVAQGCFDFDDVGSKFGQQGSRVRPGEDRAEVQHAQSFEWTAFGTLRRARG